jgi:hypothetical protein
MVGDRKPGQQSDEGTGSDQTSGPAKAGASTSGFLTSSTVLRPLNVEDQALTPTVVEVTESSWNQARTRERMRSILAASLVLLLAVVTLLPLVLVAAKLVPMDDLDTLLKIVFAPVVALVGSVVGFYFGAEVAARETEPGGGT